MGRNIRIFVTIFFVLCIAASGCYKRSAVKKPAESLVVNIEHAGAVISADCLVTFYEGKENRYVSQQKHTIYPAAGIKVQADEPEGHFEYVLANGVYSSLKDPSATPVALCTSQIARIIELTVSAKGGFIEQMGRSPQESVSIAGRMYQPVLVDNSQNSSVKLKVYRELSSKRIEWVEVNDTTENVLIIARCYNIRKLGDGKKVIPTAIDIYDTDSSGQPANRIMNIEYKSFALTAGQ